jgi:hypothetical protein
MKLMQLTTFVLLLSAGIGPAGARQIYSATQGRDCRDVSKQYMALRVCFGPSGFEVTLADEGNVAAVTFARAGYARSNGPTAAWRATGEVFGNLIEWHIGHDGRPYAAILRTWERNDQEEPVVFLRVFALSATAACEVGKVTGRRRDANAEAARLADRAVRYDCLKPPPDQKLQGK